MTTVNTSRPSGGTDFVKPSKPCADTAPHRPHRWGVGDLRFADIDLNQCAGVPLDQVRGLL